MAKKDKEASYWPRLTKGTAKLNNITVDWNKYIDEDEENEEAGKGLNDWDPNMMNCNIFKKNIKMEEWVDLKMKILMMKKCPRWMI